MVITPSKLLRIRADKRIGPHNFDILSIIFGSLLGDGYAERRIKGTRISFYQEGSHLSYILWLHSKLVELGYCSTNIPSIKTRLGKKGIVRKVIRFHT
jgi:ubiquinol-cytochrome c reductase cytochrome b subunit